MFATIRKYLTARCLKSKNLNDEALRTFQNTLVRLNYVDFWFVLRGVDNVCALKK
jgi:hypothetical protein